MILSSRRHRLDSPPLATQFTDPPNSPGHAAPNRPLLNACSWPAVGVRERQLFGGPTRTAGLGQGDRRPQDPQSTHVRHSRLSIARLRPTFVMASRDLIGRIGIFQCPDAL